MLPRWGFWGYWIDLRRLLKWPRSNHTLNFWNCWFSREFCVRVWFMPLNLNVLDSDLSRANSFFHFHKFKTPFVCWGVAMDQSLFEGYYWELQSDIGLISASCSILGYKTLLQLFLPHKKSSNPKVWHKILSYPNMMAIS